MWPPGAVWHVAHELLFGCVNAQLEPARLWQVTHAPGLCAAGAVWQFAQLLEECLYTARLNGTAGEWHVVHVAPKCFAGAVWHAAQSVATGCEKAHCGPG